MYIENSMYHAYLTKNSTTGHNLDKLETLPCSPYHGYNSFHVGVSMGGIGPSIMPIPGLVYNNLIWCLETEDNFKSGFLNIDTVFLKLR